MVISGVKAENGAVFHIEVALIDPQNDTGGRSAQDAFKLCGIEVREVREVRVFHIAGDITMNQAELLAREFLAEGMVEMFTVNSPVIPSVNTREIILEIRRRPGVMDPAESSIRKGAAELGVELDWAHCSRKYILSGVNTPEDVIIAAAWKTLANSVIEEINPKRSDNELNAKSVINEIPVVRLTGLSDTQLIELSQQRTLSLDIAEMHVVRDYFAKQGRDPNEIELETIAQTWSEHCCHKTLRGIVAYQEEGKDEVIIDNLLKSTIMTATQKLNYPWCLSVFKDNAGVIDFDGVSALAFKVETHNHPSAIEPYGGAGTGVGGVIRDPMGTGLGGKPILNTDVFCFGPPNLSNDELPKGALHPLRVMRGVVAGVSDYGNRMGIPTASGAVYFDKRYTGNPLVFCGNLAIMPGKLAQKGQPRPGQVAVVVGGRTGRDGIHGATFSSVQLTEDSEMASSGAVQIGNPIEEKKVLDFLLRARDAKLYSAITDCGAGGLSSAIGELGSDCGVIVDLEKAPLKYAGLSPTEIWISEAQERMVLVCDPEQVADIVELATEENVEVAQIGRFTDDKKLTLRYQDKDIGCLDMEFLHDGFPRQKRKAVWAAPKVTEPEVPSLSSIENFNRDVALILQSGNVCSKEAIIRRYDHEVQAMSVIKPLVGDEGDGPSDAIVIAPILGNNRAVAVSCGMNPLYSDHDPYWMAANAIDEALRNLVCVGASLKQCAVLDNFCWGDCSKPDRLGGLVRAAQACHDYSLAFGVPFISGKDSLNNEYEVAGERIAIPGTLLISALAVMDDLNLAVTMDLKHYDSYIYMLGLTKNELGGSHYYYVNNLQGGIVPKVDAVLSTKVFNAVSAVTQAGLALSLHDCSEGGAAIALSEMAFSGNFGLSIDLSKLPTDGQTLTPHQAMFAESSGRIIAEVQPKDAEEFEKICQEYAAPFARIGESTNNQAIRVTMGDTLIFRESLKILKNAWQQTLTL